MKKKLRSGMYDKFSIKDAVVILLSLIAFTALIFLIRYSQQKTKTEQEQLYELSSNYKPTNEESSLQEMQESLVFNEVNQAGWIELYNKDKSSKIDLSNCFITVNGEKKYTFDQNASIEANDFFCVEGLGVLGDKEHEIIGICNVNGEILKNIMIPSLKKEESYGCSTDGDIGYAFLTASKQKSNSESETITKEELAFSIPGGFYNESFDLVLTAAKDSTIYYTLDGTEPTKESIKYEEPILIENKSGSKMTFATAEGINYPYSYQPSGINIGMVVRAIAVDRNGNSSEPVTQSYYIGFKKASDYVNIPVLSITTEPANLFDYFDGIYVTGRSYEDAIARGEDGGASGNYLNGWEREVYVEYFEPNKDKTYEGNMTISIINDYSVDGPQKSLLLTGESGNIQGSSLKNYYSSIDHTLLVQTNKRDNSYKIREYLANKLLSNTTVGMSDITPCIVFIDGEYWGGYMLRAKYDEEYISNHYEVQEDDVLIVESGLSINDWDYKQLFDEFYSFVTTKDLKKSVNYEWVKEHMDVQNYLEYFCANVYLANADYGLDKMILWRTIQENGTGYADGKWRFLMPKLDNTMNNRTTGAVSTSSINTYLQSGVSEDLFFQSLLKNQEFREKLQTVMVDMVNNNFSSERVVLSISEISSLMKKMVESSYKRFSGYLGTDFYTKEIEEVQSFFDNRGQYILRYTEEILSGGGLNIDE